MATRFGRYLEARAKVDETKIAGSHENWLEVELRGDQLFLGRPFEYSAKRRLDQGQYLVLTADEAKSLIAILRALVEEEV